MFRNPLINRAMLVLLGAGALLAVSAARPAMAQNDDMKKDIVETATGPGMEQVTTLVQALKAADLVDALKGPGPFTVFAPTNEAFNNLPAGTLDDLMKPENKDKLRKILLFHVHQGDAISAADMKDMKLSTMEGKKLKIKVKDGEVWVDGAKVVKPDIMCSNGTIHWIDKVLMP
ncbi:MAG TPA: fasciclin domain-containing protein [Tepidisphaeraceae bacterium]|jgi:uncharacterized surface protein with fasciclin (FAS1) repeats